MGPAIARTAGQVGPPRGGIIQDPASSAVWAEAASPWSLVIGNRQ
jgi:hypothetical protein